MQRRLLSFAAPLLLAATAAAAQDAPAAAPTPAAPVAETAHSPLQPSPAWPDIRATLLTPDADPPEDAAILTLDAPARADDPALVPVHITQPPGAPPIEKLALVIDQNPAPVAATFTLGEALMPLDLEVRVRVNAYSDVRAVAWLKDGRTVMAGRFVKASGGCAAPANKTAAASDMGRMRLKSQPAPDGRTEATLMIRHPNNSGLQRDQVTLLNIPAMFIQTMEVRQGEAPWLTMDAGISISEDPVFRFAVTPGQGPVTVHAEDTDGHVFDQTLAFP